MLRRIRYASLAGRLMASFVLIILIFTAEVLFSNIAASRIAELHRHNIDFMVQRTGITMNFHQEFTEMRRLLRESFMNPQWREFADLVTWGTFEQALSDTYVRLAYLSELYNASLQADTHFALVEDDRRLYLMASTMDYVHMIYGVFSENFFQGGEMSFEHGYVLSYAWRADANLVEMRELISANQEIIMDDIARTQRMTSIVSTVAISVAVVLALLMMRTFVGKLRAIEQRAEQIAAGDFTAAAVSTTDEMSKVFSTLVGTFTRLIEGINTVMYSNRAGNTLARMNNDDFHGGYKEASIAINALLESITEAQAREQEAAERVQTMLDGNPLACYLIDGDLNVLDCNKAAVSLFQFDSKEETVYATGEIIRAGDVEAFRLHYAVAVKEGFDSFEWRLTHPNGGEIPCNISLVRFTVGDFDLMAAYVQDMTAIHQMLEQQKITQIAQSNSEAKSKFLAKMSHEIRTPISAVLGISEIQLQKPGMSLDIEEAFAKIYSSGSILLGIVNDILDLSKIEAGKMDLVHEEYEVASMVSDITQLNLMYLGSNNIGFTIDVDETMPAYLMGDELRIKQVLNNILSNAFKYTERGTVTLAVKSEPNETASQVNVQMVVTDTGRGMNEQQRLALFDEYTRFHEHEARFVEGTGLGMSITASLLTMMGATMDVQSEVGKGTQVSIVLPQQVVGDAALGLETADNLRNFSKNSAGIKRSVSFEIEPMPYGRVLIVDDVDTNLYVATGLMRRYQLEIDTAASGFACIEKIKDGEVYDIIFMDHMMPEMNGTEVTAILREMGYNAPIVALTANALVGQADEFLSNGFDGFLSKPIQTARLNGVLLKYVKRDDMVVNDIAEDDDEVEDYMTDPEIVRVIRMDFIDSQAAALVDTMAAINAGDNETAQRVVHTLKGHAALMNEKPLAACAEAVEHSIRDGVFTVGGAWAALEDEFARVHEKLRELL